MGMLQNFLVGEVQHGDKHDLDLKYLEIYSNAYANVHQVRSVYISLLYDTKYVCQ